MKFELFPFNTFQSYFSADVMALYKGKWLLCMHKERTTWEHPSGWIEEGETPLEAAKENCMKKQAQLRSIGNHYATTRLTENSMVIITTEMDKCTLQSYIH